MSGKAKSAKGPLPTENTHQIPPQPHTRECYWLVTAASNTKAFRPLFGVAKSCAGSTDRWCEVHPGELQFHFADKIAARAFALFCIRKNFEIAFRDKRQPSNLETLDALRAAARRERDAALMVRNIPERRTFPMRVELAGFYASDADDFLHRYRVTFYSKEVDYQGNKSRRAKAYVDLRMSAESLLKAIICLRSPYDLDGRALVTRLRNYNHDMNHLACDAFAGIAIGESNLAALAKCNEARVDLRYQFDAMNFRGPDDRAYYATIGSNAWLKTIETFVAGGIMRLQTALNRRSKIVPGNIVAEELARPSDYAAG